MEINNLPKPHNSSTSETQNEDPERISSTDKDLEASISEKWCLHQGFFAVMGGFVLSVEGEPGQDNQWILNEGDGVTVTPQGVLQLAKLGLLPSVKKHTIKPEAKRIRSRKHW